ncbi:hypothetical protein CSUI_005996 [Cystoisospora suis]|uniref:Uncharacterized protein n=1 Tax=Cystoisospora suis TaxID=483139 RepID=A0A2C6K2Z4_9APIC|nr:hypothetical protein CSUI_005996 [Cystoisospora suis]
MSAESGGVVGEEYPLASRLRQRRGSLLFSFFYNPFLVERQEALEKPKRSSSSFHFLPSLEDHSICRIPQSRLLFVGDVFSLSNIINSSLT